MSRLLHAAARGARIQTRWYDSDEWQTSASLVFKDTMRRYRIHPNDEHLQYGPISTALRMLAEDDSWNPSEERSLAVAVARQFQVFFDDEPDFELFYLFLAEFLADEGM